MIRTVLAVVLVLATLARLAAVDFLPGLPDFGATPTVTNARSGPWSEAGTWSPARVPGEGDVVRIAPGTAVAYDLDSRVHLAVVRVDGRLAFRTDRDTRLAVATLLVTESGELEVGTAAAPIPDGRHARIVFADRPLDLATDPAQYGDGLIGLGRITVHGAPRIPPFARLAVEPHAGDTTLTVAAPIWGWRPGDRLVLPDSRCLEWYERPALNTYASHREEPTLSAVSADGLTVTLSAPLAFDHPGCRDEHDVITDLPHVADLTRSVELSSENPAGTRGHVILSRRAVVDIRWAAFHDLGRTTNAALDSTEFDTSGRATHVGTNQIGRYPLHLHHLDGPAQPPANGFQYTLIGNAIDGGTADHDRKWGIAVHASHYGLVNANIVYNYQGAGIATEDGSETRNLIDGNFVARVRGTGDRGGMGRDGIGFWFRGVNNWVMNNVATDIGDGVYCYGFNYFQLYLGDVQIPDGPGLETTHTVNSYTIPILGFAGNEVYGVVPNGLTFWWVGTFGGLDRVAAGESVIRDFRVWNHYRWAIFAYPSDHVTIDHLVVHGDERQLASGNGVQGIVFSDYSATRFVVRDSEFRGLTDAIEPTSQALGAVQDIERCRFRCFTGVATGTLWSVSAFGDSIMERTVAVRDCRFDLSPYHGRTPVAISRVFNGGTNPVRLDRLLVGGFQGERADAFEVFFAAQRADELVPQTTYNGDGSVQHPGSPEAGLTNAQAWSRYGIAIAGKVAPANAAPRAGIDGLTLAIAATSLPPGPEPTSHGTPPPSLPDGAVGGTAGAVAGSGGDGGSRRCGVGGLLGLALATFLVARRRRA